MGFFWGWRFGSGMDRLVGENGVFFHIVNVCLWWDLIKIGF